MEARICMCIRKMFKTMHHMYVCLSVCLPVCLSVCWKNTVFRDFSTCSRTCIFFPLTLSLLWSSFFFSSLTLPTSAFSSVHIVRSLTSKLPLISLHCTQKYIIHIIHIIIHISYIQLYHTSYIILSANLCQYVDYLYIIYLCIYIYIIYILSTYYQYICIYYLHISYILSIYTFIYHTWIVSSI